MFSKKNKHIKKTSPIIYKEEVAKNPDNKIDEDFPGFPHAPSQTKMIKPVSEKDKLTANVKNIPSNNNKIDEQDSNGSGGAFDATERLTDDE